MSGKNYYEILGVRPHAGREEIELAYKGRRSQYHPDRYAQADTETQAWATRKMQEVNEAYQVLTGPELRAKFDQRRTSDGSGDSESAQEEPAKATEAKDAASVLLKPEWEWFHDKVYARPNIPSKKLEGGISSYAPGVSPREVIVLLDDTLFGGAKEGLLVTNDAIYSKQKFEGPRRMAFSAIQQVEPGTDSRVLINGIEFFKADLIGHAAILNFASRLSSVFKPPVSSANDRSASQSVHGASGVDGLWRLHRGAMAALRAESVGRTLLIDQLIDRQMRCIANNFSELRDAVGGNPRRGQGPVDAESAELALMLFLVLHYYGFSKLPSAFKEEAGDRFTQLHEVSEVYKLAFREGFPLVYRRPIELDEEDLLTMSVMFLHRDGDGEFELKIPREEALLLLLTRMGIQRETAKELIRQFEDHAEAWLDELYTRAAG
jgi:curved DNA-binding protein CbpA